MRRTLSTLVTLAALAAGCGGRQIVPLLSSAGIPITATPTNAVPLEVVTRSTSVRDPLPVTGTSVTYRPITSELFQLHTEIGKDYYEEIIGPEFRSAARNVLARHSYTALVGNLDKVEDEIEEEVRRRIRNKHVEVSSITLEKIKYASPEIASAVEKRLIGQQEAARQKAAIEAQAARDKTQLELAAAQAKLKAESDANQARVQNEITAEKSKREAELALLQAKNQKEVLEHQIAIDKLEAQQKVIRANAAMQERTLLANAKAAEMRAEGAAHNAYTVQAAGYEALGKLGGHGTTIFLGDWSRAPQFLWPRQYQLGAPPVAPLDRPATLQLPAPGGTSTKRTSVVIPTGTMPVGLSAGGGALDTPNFPAF